MSPRRFCSELDAQVPLFCNADDRQRTIQSGQGPLRDGSSLVHHECWRHAIRRHALRECLRPSRPAHFLIVADLVQSAQDMQISVGPVNPTFETVVTIDERDQPKYINSPETEVYHKKEVLYGLHQAKRPIRQTDEVLLVEGYTDVIACHQAGITNVVATLGTALSSKP